MRSAFQATALRRAAKDSTQPRKRITVILGLVARQRHQPGFGLQASLAFNWDVPCLGRPPYSVQMPAKANSGRSSLSANHTTSFFLVSGLGSGAYSAKLLAGTKHRFSGFSQPRQCGDSREAWARRLPTSWGSALWASTTVRSCAFPATWLEQLGEWRKDLAPIVS
jgi:hypothetical protein